MCEDNIMKLKIQKKKEEISELCKEINDSNRRVVSINNKLKQNRELFAEDKLELDEYEKMEKI